MRRPRACRLRTSRDCMPCSGKKTAAPTYLGTLGDAANTMFNAASSINGLGDVVGTSQFTDGTIHSFLWKKGIGMQDLGALPGAFVTVAGCCNTVNNRD